MGVLDTPLDTQALGWMDDYSESGHLRVRPTSGDLVAVPVHPLQYYAEASGGGTTTLQTTGIFSNPDGSGSALTMAVVGTNPPNAGVRVWLPFYGRAFGIRWRRDSVATIPPYLSVSVDGVAVGVSTTVPEHLVLEGIPSASYVDGEARAITHPVLPAGPHLAEITLIQLPYPSTATSQIQLYGFLLDAAAGYRPLPRMAHLVTGTPLTITTSAVEIPALRATATAMRGIRKVIYTNISGSTTTVTVQLGSAVIWQKAIAAADSADFDLGSAVSLPGSTFTHQASANSAINATVIGEY